MVIAEQAAEEQVWQCCLLIHGRFLVPRVGRFLSGRAHSLKSSQKPSASKIFLGLFGSQSQYGARAVDGQWMGAGPPFLTSWCHARNFPPEQCKGLNLQEAVALRIISTYFIQKKCYYLIILIQK